MRDRALAVLLLVALLAGQGWCSPPSRPAPREVRQAVRAELASGAYSATPDQRALAEVRASIIQRIVRGFVSMLEWLGKKLGAPLLGPQFGVGIGPMAVRVLLMVVAIAILGSIVYVLLRLWRGARDGRLRADVALSAGAGLRGSDQELLSLTARRALAIARRAASDSDFRRALRYCFIALLVRLSELGLYDLDPKRTNHEYERRLPGESDERAVFADALAVFERKWYGLEDVSRPEYEAYERRLLALIGDNGGRA